MTRPMKILVASLVVSLLAVGFCQTGWTEEKYKVKPGDSLSSISKSFGVSVEALKTANALEGDSIRPQQVLSIPPARTKKVVHVTGKPSNPPTTKHSAELLKRDSNEMDSYAVMKGDTLSGISKKVGLSVEEIKRMNNLRTSTLKIGQVLSFRKDQSDEEAEELGDAEETTGMTQAEVDKGGTVDSNALGKWNNPEERSLLVRVVKTFLGVPYKL